MADTAHTASAPADPRQMLPETRAGWDRLHLHYRCLAALETAAYGFGHCYRVNAAHELLCAQAERELGTMRRAWADPRWRALLDASDANTTATEDETYRLYASPALDAAKALLRHPAPDIEAVETKLQLIRERSLHDLVETDLFAIIAADIARLAH